MAKILVTSSCSALGWDGRNYYSGDEFIMADTAVNEAIALQWVTDGKAVITVPFLIFTEADTLDGEALVRGVDNKLDVNVDKNVFEIVNDTLGLKDQGVTGDHLLDSSVSNSKLINNDIKGVKIADDAYKLLVFTGVAAAGACTLTGVNVGDVIVDVINITDYSSANINFEAVITVKDEIQQTVADDLSAKKFIVLVKNAS